MKRYAGVLLSVTSLPSKYGIGCFDQAAYDFVDWLEASGQKYWQILPLTPTGFGMRFLKPYSSRIQRQFLSIHDHGLFNCLKSNILEQSHNTTCK